MVVVVALQQRLCALAECDFAKVQRLPLRPTNLCGDIITIHHHGSINRMDPMARARTS